MINDCDPRLKKMLEQINTDCEMKHAIRNASLDLYVAERLAGKPQVYIDAYFDGWDDALTDREEMLKYIHEKHEELYRTHPEFFLTENATKEERAEYWRLHNI